MGVFQLMTEQTANGRPVWQKVGGKEQYTYFMSNGKWGACNEENIREGSTAADVQSAAAEPGALTPDAVTGG